MKIQLKRIYDDTAQNDGYRVLVDGMWPRGIAKRDARIDEWYKTLAPSKELRQWFGHDRERWQAFRKAYLAELAEANTVALDELREIARQQQLTLLFAARDVECNHAVVLKAYLETCDDREKKR
ncbi:DUF488 family protein [Salinicola salarius]|uniref:DUF488 domain-containing protein n=1 Tax=Salinicola salarius TaxID=430457 RepID=UPI0023E45DDC|nr:DUF488 family protein [Salinicola salarius]MDF3920233.1 DUF488 family protein [Salinicola salarius]